MKYSDINPPLQCFMNQSNRLVRLIKAFIEALKRVFGKK